MTSIDIEPAERIRSFRSSKALGRVGTILGAVITVVVALFVLADLNARVDAARRQSSALAQGADRVLSAELSNLERTARGLATGLQSIAENAPSDFTLLSQKAARTTESLYPELTSISVFDGSGALLVGNPGSAVSTWLRQSDRETGRLVFGPITALQSGSSVLPFALGTPQDHLLISGLRVTRLQRMIERLDMGKNGSIAVLDQGGRVLARYGGLGAYAGHTIPLPSLLASKAAVNVNAFSKIDGVSRFVSFSSESGYPFVVVAGISTAEVLAPWRTQFVFAIVLVSLYWLGMGYLVRRLAQAEGAQGAILEEFEAQADWLRQAQAAADLGVWRVESEAGLVRTSAQAAAMFGFPRTPGAIPLDNFFNKMHSEDRERVAREFALARAQSSPFHSEYRVLLEPGIERWISARGAMVSDVRGHSYMAGTIVDITASRRQAARLQQARLQAQDLFDRNPLPFWVFDSQTLRFLAVNEAAVRSYGYSREEFLQMTILDIRPSGDTQHVRDVLSTGIEPGESKRIWIHLTKDNRIVSALIHSTSTVFDGRAARLVLAEDVSERVAFQKELSWRAEHDVTTGLLNLPALIDFLEETQRISPESSYGICYVQLRDFDLVRPTLGGSASNNILREAGKRFGAVSARHGFIAYHPADSFVIAALDATRIEELVEALKEAISIPFENEDGGSYPLEAWIGIALGPVAGETAENIVSHAALAALQAHRDSLPALKYEASMGEAASRRFDLVSTLKLAHERRQFELFFQPIHRISDGRITCLEALLRWPQTDGSFIPPDQFIPLCEESGIIVPIGAWVLEQAARASGVIRARGLRDVAIAVNVSAVQFVADSLPNVIRELRARFDLPRDALHVELTESALLRRPDAVRSLMDDLRIEGVCISIDDFGTGFSSMAYLRDLPLDYLKLDRSFVSNVDRDPRNASICKALIALAHGLGLQVIAEGVETKAQIDWLRDNNCDQAQGYYLGKPARLLDLLDSWQEA